MEFILSGRMIGAKEAHRSGLVDHVTQVSSLEKDSLRFLDSLTSQHSTKLIRTVMQSIHNGCHLKREEALMEETRLFCELAAAVREGNGA